MGNARLGAFGVESSERGGPRRDGRLVGGRTVETGGWWTRRPPRKSQTINPPRQEAGKLPGGIAPAEEWRPSRHTTTGR